MSDKGLKPAKKIAVIGAGIVGVSTAIWLQRSGVDVMLIDKKGPAAGASYGNGGVLASCAVVPVNSPGLFKSAPKMLLQADSPLFLRWAYLPKLLPWLVKYTFYANAKDARHAAKALTQILYDSFDQHYALAKGTGAEKWLKSSDYVFAYKDKPAFEKDAFAWGVRAEMGFKWEEMDASTFHQYDPIFQGTQKFAVRLKNHGMITDPGAYVSALARHVENRGGKFIKAQVDDIVIENGNTVGVQTSNGLVKCDGVVLAAGVWSKPIAEKLGINIPLETERGYHIELINPSVMPRSPYMLASGKFVVTPMQGRLRCAGIVEFGGLQASAGRQPFALLKKQILNAIPGIKYDQIDEWMGHRPALPDSIPAIGPIKSATGSYAAFGHHHIGLTGGPKTGSMIADMIANKNVNMDVQPYEVSRFA